MRPGLTRTLLVLTFVTGIVDAVSFLGLGQVFAAMQTGNVIFLGLGIAGTAGAPVVSLVAFVAGGGLAALLARRHPPRPTSAPASSPPTRRSPYWRWRWESATRWCAASAAPT